MLTPKMILLLALAGFGLFFLAAWLAAVREKETAAQVMPNWKHVVTGVVTDFFDVLGIGSFATTTSFYKFWQLVRDEVLPGTLNVGHTLPTIAQAFIFVAVIEVDFTTLVLMILAAVLGMWLGAGYVARWPRRAVQIGMGVALLAAAILMALSALKIAPAGGTDLALSGMRLGIGLVGNFVLGTLMSMGIGLYGPCLILVSLLGMNPLAAFPIMMGSCAFLMPLGSTRFIKPGSYDLRAALGLTLGGIPAVLVAAFLVKSLPLQYVRWLVVIVVLYTSAMLLRSAIRERQMAAAAESAIS